MNFKEALIAHLQGEKVEVRTEPSHAWMDFGYGVSHVTVRDINEFSKSPFEYRIAPRMIVVNGVQVPAPETEAPAHDQIFFISDPTNEEGFSEMYWRNDRIDKSYLRLGIVYLDKESARARAKAMLITQEGVKP